MRSKLAIASLESIVRLSPAARQEMTEVDAQWCTLQHLWHTGQYLACAELAEHMLQVLRRHLDEPNCEVATAHRYVAISLSHADNYAKAEPLLRESLRMYHDLYGNSGAEVAFSLEYLGELYAAQGDTRRAEPLYREAAELTLQVGAGAPAVGEPLESPLARIWARLATLNINNGDYVSALALLRTTLPGVRARPDCKGAHWLPAMLINDLGLVSWKQGDLAAAESLLTEAHEMRRSDLGDLHPHTIQSLQSLGMVLCESGHPERATELLQEALARFKGVRVEGHPDIATTLLCLARVYRARGDWAGADSLGREALEMQRQFPSAVHTSVAECLRELANPGHFQ